MFSLTNAAVEKFDNQHEFERLCAAILNAKKYDNVCLVAPRGGADGGEDVRYTTRAGENGLACVTLRKDIKVKFNEDFSQRKSGDFKEYRLFCSNYLTPTQKTDFEDYVKNNLGATLICEDSEAISNLLDSSSDYDSIKATYLKIPVYHSIRAERDELRKLVNHFNKKVFSAPYPDEDPIFMLHSLRQTRLALQLDMASTFSSQTLPDTDFAYHFQRAQSILAHIESNVELLYPEIARAVPQEPNKEVDEQKHQKARIELGNERYWKAVELMMSIRGELWRHVDEATNGIAKLEAKMKPSTGG